MSALPIAAPATFPDVFILPSGTKLVLRAVQGGDRERVHELFTRLSEESRYRRFLTPKHELSGSELVFLSDIDHVSHEAIAAVDQRDGSFVGVVRVVRRPDSPEAADMAIEVADELQGMGIGSCLTARMLERATEIGFTTLTATTLRQNPAARALLKRFGFTPYAGDGREIEFERDLGYTDSSVAA
jgi:RimJ/RimL family protein N-acetyltransferase